MTIKGYLDLLPRLVEEVAPLAEKHRKVLAHDVRDLSALFTTKRADLAGRYMAEPRFISAYLRYFLQWNVWRLTSLLQDVELQKALFPDAASSCAALDLGSGPLTFPIALWIAAPALRNKKIVFHCADINREILKKGCALFEKLTTLEGGACAWEVKTHNASIMEAKKITPKGGVNLVSAVNVYNELFAHFKAEDRHALSSFAEREASRLRNTVEDGGRVFIVEPGTPRSGEFITCVRDAAINAGFFVDAPCVHADACPMGSGKLKNRAAKWCHFTFPARTAPKYLQVLSKNFKLSKERGALSYLLLSRKAGDYDDGFARITSESFPLPNGAFARYACSKRGLSLVIDDKSVIDRLPNGGKARISFTGGVDRKSGAALCALANAPSKKH